MSLMDLFTSLWWIFELTLTFGGLQAVISEDDQKLQFRECQSVTGCECQNFDFGVTGVVCENVTDFLLLSMKLGDDGGVFSPGETYEITIKGTPSFPRRSFEGLIIYRLIIDDIVTQNVSSLVFEGVSRLRRFHVRASSMKRIPELGMVSNSLRRLNFDGSQLTAIGSELQHLPLLVEVTLRNNKISKISADAFLGSSAITVLDLSENDLWKLPPTLLDDLKALRKLDLSRNKLYSIAGLLRVVRPTFIYLSRNNLSNADEILYENMTAVVTLSLDHNPLRNLSETSFNGKIPKVRFLYLDYCGIREFDVNHFRYLNELSLLEFSGNSIRVIRNQTIDFGDSLQLFFYHNNIESFEALITYTSKRLYLTGNRLRLLGSMLQLTQLQEVELNNNFLEALIETDFRGMHGTEVLMFRGNYISRLDEAVFVSIRNDLEVLDLSFNQLTSLNRSIQYLSRLKSLNVSKNYITSFRDGEFIGLNELSELYMQQNMILSLGGHVGNVPRLQIMVVSHNQITTLKMNDFPKSLRYFFFKSNPISCDCRLMPLLKWFRNSSLESDSSYCLRKSRNVSRKDIKREEHVIKCPAPCRCSCVQDLTLHPRLKVECAYRNLSISPDVFSRRHTDSWFNDHVREYFGQLIVMMQNVDEEFAVADRVVSIDVENNQLTTLNDWILPYDLEELRLANNFLLSVPNSVMRLSKLRKISLSGNPWTCDCSTTYLKNWFVRKAEKVIDRNETRCGSQQRKSVLNEKLLVELFDSELCPNFTGLYVGAASSVIVLLLVATALKLAYSHYEMHIKVWLFAHGITWVKENELDTDKPFDAFISFSNKDEDFVVNNIISEIEKNLPEMHLCLHYRDFLPGEYIHVNIMNAITNSKRTIIVLSRNFLESEWCMLEFRAAHLQALEDRVQRLIVVKVGEIPDEIDPAIKVYLESTTYVTWGEKYFWQKLAYAIPTSGKQHRKTSSTDSTSTMF